MQGYDVEEAKRYILSKLDHKPFRAVEKQLPEWIAEMIDYDLHFMRVTGVINENGEQGENDYDDDEAFEFIYDAWLSDHPENDDEDMVVADLLNRYMECQYGYLQRCGLADV